MELIADPWCRYHWNFLAQPSMGASASSSIMSGEGLVASTRRLADRHRARPTAWRALLGSPRAAAVPQETEAGSTSTRNSHTALLRGRRPPHLTRHMPDLGLEAPDLGLGDPNLTYGARCRPSLHHENLRLREEEDGNRY